MSLINDMLRDLSSQQATTQTTQLVVDDLQAASWEQEKIANFFQHSRVPLMLVTLAIFILGYGLMRFLINEYQADQQLASVVQQGKLEIIANSSGHQITPAVIDPIPQTVKLDAEPNQRQPIPERLNDAIKINQQTDIYRLIDQASRAMTLDRLTSPENDNAYFYYQELLKLDAENEIAFMGMRKITDRYLQMAEKSIQKNDFSKAQFFLEKARGVTPDDQRIDILRRNIVSQDIATEKSTNESANVESVAVESIVASDPFEQSVNPQTNVTGADSEASLAITPNIEFLDQQAVQQAQELITQGFQSKALDILENHIQLYRAPISEQYLLDIYYQNKNQQAMERLLASSLTIPSIDQVYYSARVQLLKGDNQSAIHLLESQLSQAATHENYRALLAGLYQRDQHYLQAISAYRNLLQSFQPKPAYWLGLALSLDAETQIAAAVHAYTQLLSFQQLEPQVQDYARARIAELSRDQIQ